MPMCRSPPFLSKNADKKEMEETLKEYYLYVNGQRVKVSEQIYQVYWRDGGIIVQTKPRPTY